MTVRRTGRTPPTVPPESICEECGHDLIECHAAFGRIRELEAELVALRKEAIEGSWRARAEKAEARVAELEDALKACIDETPAMWAREKEEC